MGVQFVHMEAYAPVAARKRRHQHKEGFGLAKILNEAERRPGSCPHVAKPAPPIWHIGSRKEVESTALAWHAQAKQVSGRAAKSTSPCLLAAVASLARVDEAQWPEYRARTVEYFTDLYGDRVVGVVEHTDEDHPHIHIYVVPRRGERWALHPGQEAARVARHAPGNLVRTEFKRAMVEFQNAFHERVGGPVGLERDSTRRARIPREEHMSMKRIAEAARRADEQAAQVLATAKSKADAQLRRAQTIADQVLLAKQHVDRLAREADESPAGMLAALKLELQRERDRADAAEYRNKLLEESNAKLRGTYVNYRKAGAGMLATPKPTPFKD